MSTNAAPTVSPDPIDLSQLRRPEVAVRAPKRRLRWLVPLLLVLGFAAVLGSTLTDWLAPRYPVSVVRPTDIRGAVAAAGAIVLQAAGYVEPDPFPTKVTALTGGVVKRLLVQESDAVEEGALIAELHPESLQAAVAEATAEVAIAAADLERRRIAVENAQLAFDQPLVLEEASLVADAEEKGAAAEVVHRTASVAGRRASLEVVTSEMVILEELHREGAADARLLGAARAKVAGAEADLATAAADLDLATANHEKARTKRAITARAFTLRLDPKRDLEAARAELLGAEAAVTKAQAAEARARLDLQRTEVRAPTKGVVLARLATPGAVLDPTSAESSAVCLLYDPGSLRIRVDVPQESVGKVHRDQAVQILSESRVGRPYAGRVSRVVQQADLVKVTLQVHVRVLDPDDLLRPEMLCQVRFEGAAVEAGAPTPESAGTVRIPSRVLDGNFVWVLDARGERAEKREVTVAGRDAEWANVSRGLNASDKVIDTGRGALKPGSLVRVEGGE